jgi:tetratricopeptide repeat protein
MDSDRPTVDRKQRFRVINGSKSSLRSGKNPQDSGNSFAGDWEIPLHTWPRRIIAIVLILAASGTLIYRTWWLFLAAWITRSKPMDPGVYERAVRYDPNNADYHFVLAQIYNYTTQSLNLERAREEYEAAVRLNPNRSTHWLELSKFYEQEKDIDRCRFAMSKALETDPNYAQTHWSAANLYVRLGDQKAADYEFRRAADLDPTYVIQVLDLVWRIYADPAVIMSTHVPNTRNANLVALDYFVANQSDQGAALAWERLKAFETKPQERFNYINYLVGLHRPLDAWNVFATGLPPISGVPFYNPSFETEPLNGDFDWRFESSDDAEVRRDTTTAKDGMASIVVNFRGKQNLDYHHLWHRIPAEKGKRYVLKFWMKTDSISTNEGMYVEVDGQKSDKQVGTTYWQEFTVGFTASSELVQVTLRRDSSRKFDNLLKGKVWLDGFNVTKLG